MGLSYRAPSSPSASQSGGGVQIVADTRSMARLARDLRVGAPEVWVECRAALRAAAQPVAEDARQRAAAFSTRIPGSIKIRTGRGNVKIVAGGEQAPDAAPIENRGAGHVRHPVFGNREVWTDTNSPPAFLQPAFEAHREEVLAAVEQAVTSAVERAVKGRL